MSNNNIDRFGDLFGDLARLGGYEPGNGMVPSDAVARALGYYDGQLLRAHMRDPDNVEWRRRFLDTVAAMRAVRGRDRPPPRSPICGPGGAARSTNYRAPGRALRAERWRGYGGDRGNAGW